MSMLTLTVTSKGQVTLRRDILEHMGVQAGDRIAVEKLPDGRVEVRADPRHASIADVFGMLRRPGRKPVSIEEMNRVIAEGWAGKR
jgi:bifunctional DNA-binding transcriptional regulator/antitoxin component of YhaV-PrlF toxin-antitoxin module